MKALSQLRAGVVTLASPKPAIEPTKVAASGTNIISSGVLPVKYFPTSAATNPAATALIGWPVVKTPD